MLKVNVGVYARGCLYYKKVEMQILPHKGMYLRINGEGETLLLKVLEVASDLDINEYYVMTRFADPANEDDQDRIMCYMNDFSCEEVPEILYHLKGF